MRPKGTSWDGLSPWQGFEKNTKIESHTGMADRPERGLVTEEALQT